MTITFDTADAMAGLRFGAEGSDSITVTAHSEQIAWTNLQPKEEGYFDFDVAFVQSASMALHPPYPDGMPTIYQKISMDMGAKNPHGLAEEWILDETSTTQYASKSNTIYGNSDGYGSGSLQRVSIGEDGVLTGIYSNGRHQPLYQIGLTRFLNPWGLAKLGDNLFEETRYSGEGAMNEPGTAGNGTILGNFLEQSNVDVAEEIVNMIVTQRGFQANSKTVTTTDSMLAEVIEMKR
jgi:flagellar hook protein FlgE